MTKEQILEEIRHIAATNNGVPPGSHRFKTETGIGESAWSGKYWARWGDALREAGFPPNVWQTPHSEDVFVQSYIRLIRAIQLPEKATKVHEIRTDDPSGIEAYWHNRFAAKRRGGEWFDLDASDVNAFKRRKFM
jgi:hypothetical protein